MSTELTLWELIDRLEAARVHVEEGFLSGATNAGNVRFRFAVPWGDYAAAGFKDLDPFGRIIGVTTALDGSTYVDIVPELIDDKQGVLL